MIWVPQNSLAILCSAKSPAQLPQDVQMILSHVHPGVQATGKWGYCPLQKVDFWRVLSEMYWDVKYSQQQDFSCCLVQLRWGWNFLELSWKGMPYALICAQPGRIGFVLGWDAWDLPGHLVGALENSLIVLVGGSMNSTTNQFFALGSGLRDTLWLFNIAMV